MSSARLLTLDELGLLKVSYHLGVESSVAVGDEGRIHGAMRGCWMDENMETVAVGRKDGAVQLWRVDGEKNSALSMERELLPTLEKSSDGDDTNIAAVLSLSSKRRGNHGVVAIDSNGLCRIARNRVVYGGSGANGTSPPTNLYDNMQMVGPVETGIMFGEGMVATGGKENDVKLWDIEEQKCTWRAKNIGMNAKLQLRVPVWVTSLAQLVAPSTLVCTSAHRHIRLYDVRSKRRPVQSSLLEGHSLTTVAVTPSGNELVVGDGMGCLRVIDLKTLKPKLRLLGPVGSIRSLVCHEEQPFVASAGLDRYARVHNISTGDLVSAVYLKQRLNCVLFCQGDIVLNSSSTTKQDDDSNSSSSWQDGNEYNMDDSSYSEEESFFPSPQT